MMETHAQAGGLCSRGWQTLRAHGFHIIIATLVCVPTVGYVAWALFDRRPPYIREAGAIQPAPPERCGLPADDPSKGTVSPGACITVNWKIRVIRNCPPDVPNNIARRIRDSESVIHTIGPIRGLFGTTAEPPKELLRFFRVPSSAVPGPAVYISRATFACNPLQGWSWSNWLFWPITIDQPDVKFQIEAAPLRPAWQPPARKRAGRG